MERSHAAPAPPDDDAQPGVAPSAARLRLASLHGPAQNPPSASGIPLSEAIAAQYYAQRPWWRRTADALGERVPATLRGRWGLEFRAAVALACLALLGAAVGGWYLWRSQATVVELPMAASVASGPVSGPGSGPVSANDNAGSVATAPLPALSLPTGANQPAVTATAPPNKSGTVVVDVEGRVAHQGVETLPAGSRVYEAIQAAGGAAPGTDATGLDLARPLVDGEQLRIGLPGTPAPPAGLEPSRAPNASHGKRAKPDQPVNLNTATAEELQTIPTIGPAMAQRILDWRTQHGRFATVAQLRQVRGIGDRKFAELRDSVTV